MTIDEAIKVLEMVKAHGLADEAKKMAIKALECSKGRTFKIDINGNMRQVEDTVIIVQPDCLMKPDVLEKVRMRLISEAEDGIVILPYWMQIKYIGPNCAIEIKREREDGQKND